MKPTRRGALQLFAAAPGVLSRKGRSAVTKYVRFRHGTKTAHGILDGETIRELRDSPFEGVHETGAKHRLAEVKLLAPCQPPKILAVGLNYRSHLGDRKAPERPEIFYKPITSLQHPDESIVIPPDATDVHYEGELVVVIGKPTKNVTVEKARDHIFGVTCGNDVSERQWQNGANKDLQWWRAKGADTFAPCGPVIVQGLDYGKVLLQTRLNGEVVQKQVTSDLIFDCPTIVSHISRFVTLMPGDLIYTGTPGQTRKMKPGDVVEVEIEGIGVLKNKVA
ncbi:MAG TPA: fumarylacetoacetate hydrolase family protein [Polyangia bacterium]|nr:fumarylacetoacetate hydrolase family protein [Polyangia bacterium]